MKKKLKAVSKKTVRIFSNMRLWAFKNWVKYTYIKNLFFVVLFPILGVLASRIPFLVNCIFIAFIGGSAIFVMVDSKRIKVAEENPEIFVKTEKIESNFSKLFYIFYVMVLMSLPLFFYSQKLNLDVEITSTILVVIISAWTGLLVNFEINAIESAPLLTASLIKRVKKKRRHWFDFFPSNRIRARARFYVISKMLTQNPNKEQINSKFPLFWEAITIYNNHIRKQFKFILRDPKKFYCYAKLATYVETRKNIIRTQFSLRLSRFIPLFD